MTYIEKKVLFLDVDGVLNSQQWFKSAYYQKIKNLHPGHSVQGVDWDNAKSRKAHCKIWGPRHLNPNAINDLNYILEQTRCNVVISSTWRTIFSLEDIINMLTMVGLDGHHSKKFIGTTPVLHQPRGLEIQAWLDTNQIKPEQIVILDDDNDMKHLSHRLVLTHVFEGLTPDHAKKVIQMLNSV